MIKINSLELENVKRVKAVKLDLKENGLTVIGGRNGQGKTSVLDAIAWALGGAKHKPGNAIREGSHVPPKLEVTLSNGLVVRRSGVNSELKVIDPSGEKAGQRLLDSFIGELALNIPAFMQMSQKEKGSELLKLLKVEDELLKLESEYNSKYMERREVGRIATSKDKYAKELPYYDDVPEAPISAIDLIKSQQEILAKNGENQRKRQHKESIEQKAISLKKEVERLQKELEKVTAEYQEAESDLVVASASVKDLVDESTEELERQIENIETINIKVRANEDKDNALIEAGEYQQKYDELSVDLEGILLAKKKLLDQVEMPLDGLSIDDGLLTYHGKQWDCMSSAEQLKVSAAIVKALNPECGFILMDKLEQMDKETLAEFGEWATSQDLQIIATRVSSDRSECSVIIEDGAVKNDWGEF